MAQKQSQTQNAFDLAVVGTGPAGMVAALCAAKAGLRTVLIGPPINSDDKRTSALLAPSLDVLGDLGLDEDVSKIGTALVTMRLLDGSRRLLRAPAVSFAAEEIGRAFFGLNCPNALLNAMLDRAVQNEPQISSFSCLVASYDLDGSHPKLTLEDGSALEAKAVLAADGKRSPAREAAGIAVRRWSYEQTAAVGVVRHAKPHEYISTEFHTASGPFTFVPMPDEAGHHRSSFVCALTPQAAEELAAMDLEAASCFLEKRAQHLLGALALEAPVQLWPLEALLAERFAAKGIYLAGEAAHAFPPIGAQGLNLSIRDGVDALALIAQALKKGEAPSSEAWARRYTAKRRVDVWARTYGMHALNTSLLSRNPLMQVGRAAAMSAAQGLPVFKKGLMVAGLEPMSFGAMATSLRKVMRPV